MKRKDYTTINKNLRDFVQIGSRVNELEPEINNSLEHEVMKTIIWHALKEQGHHVITEVRLKKGGRPIVTGKQNL